MSQFFAHYESGTVHCKIEQLVDAGAHGGEDFLGDGHFQNQKTDDHGQRQSRKDRAPVDGLAIVREQVGRENDHAHAEEWL